VAAYLSNVLKVRVDDRHRVEFFLSELHWNAVGTGSQLVRDGRRVVALHLREGMRGRCRVVRQELLFGVIGTRAERDVAREVPALPLWASGEVILRAPILNLRMSGCVGTWTWVIVVTLARVL